MPPSKLEKYLNILESLVNRPKKIEQIAQKAHMEQNVLKRHLVFLLSNGVVEKRSLGSKQVVYALTDRGLAVFKTLRALNYLEKLRDSLPIVEEAREIAAVLSKRSREWKEE
jgi:DNA-binding HxlR family transcriptional regulator